MPHRNVFYIVCLTSGLCACSKDQADRPPQDAGHAVVEPDAALTQPPISNGNGSAEAAFELPENSSFERARMLEVGGDTMQRVVNVTQVDHYSFEARAGAFYVLSTDACRRGCGPRRCRALGALRGAARPLINRWAPPLRSRRAQRTTSQA